MINPSNFYFISEKYFSVIYYYALYVETGNKEDLKQAQFLSIDMGNRYLESFLVEN